MRRRLPAASDDSPGDLGSRTHSSAGRRWASSSATAGRPRRRAGSRSGPTGPRDRRLGARRHRPGRDRRAAGQRPASPRCPAAKHHANGAIGIDHVVIVTPDFDRTAGASTRRDAAATHARRRRDSARASAASGRRSSSSSRHQDARRPKARRASGASSWSSAIWRRWRSGSATTSATIKPAVQPGARIATLRDIRRAVTEAVAFMDPES